MLTMLTALAVAAVCAVARRWFRAQRRKQAYGPVEVGTVWNSGAAFGLPVPKKALLAVSALVVVLLWCFRRKDPVGTGLVLGGGISNLWERCRHGRVCDYLCFPGLPKPLSRYVYNLADFAIFAGCLRMVFRRK